MASQQAKYRAQATFALAQEWQATLYLAQLKAKAVERVKASEAALAEEKSLNDERKRKMKVFVETKAEELRVAKAQNEDMQSEVEELRTTLRETREKLEHVHAEWQKVQTRNRELMREMKSMKKNSEKMHKMGGDLEMELSKSTQETEEHKNKRMTAKHELMTILRTLEAEQSSSSKLRDSIKFTFTPKALSQQQLISESLKDFEIELERLSRRLGKPLPPPPMSMNGHSNGGDDGINGATAGRKGSNKSETDSQTLLTNLESETQKVSQAILKLQVSVERLHAVIGDDGDRTCASALQDIIALMAQGQSGPAAATVASNETNGSPVGRGGRKSKYGLVPEETNHLR